MKYIKLFEDFEDGFNQEVPSSNIETLEPLEIGKTEETVLAWISDGLFFTLVDDADLDTTVQAIEATFGKDTHINMQDAEGIAYVVSTGDDVYFEPASFQERTPEYGYWLSPVGGYNPNEPSEEYDAAIVGTLQKNHVGASTMGGHGQNNDYAPLTHILDY